MSYTYLFVMTFHTHEGDCQEAAFLQMSGPENVRAFVRHVSDANSEDDDELMAECLNKTMDRYSIRDVLDFLKKVRAEIGPSLITINSVSLISSPNRPL